MHTTTKSFQGDRDALFSAVYRAKQAQILAFARSLTDNRGLRSQADDVMQTIFLRLHKTLVRGGFPEVTVGNWMQSPHDLRLQGWLFAAAVLVVREFRRQQQNLPTINLEAIVHDEGPITFVSSPLEPLLLEEARQQCSPAERTVVDLKLQGYSSREIADRVGSAPTTVRGHLLTARRRMRAFMEADSHAASAALH